MAWTDSMKNRWKSQKPSQLLDWSLVQRRINKTPRSVYRIKTGMPSFDDFMGGGLPAGMLLLWGGSGVGKSLMAKTISRSMARNGKKVYYFFGEDSFDAPLDPPNLNIVDMVSWKPGVDKALKTILTIVDKEEPDLIVLDSLTTILSQTSKAVPEADVREYTKKLAEAVSGVIPIIATSEVRGNGNYESPAGGRGIQHASVVTLKLQKRIVETKWDANDWGGSVGDAFWTVYVEKDRDGVSQQSSVRKITYENGEICLE